MTHDTGASTLSAEGLTVRRGRREVLQGLRLELQAGWTAIVGPNGAGKSTLLRALAGLLPPVAGTVRLDGRPLADWTAPERARRLAWLPQGGDSTGELTVRETVALGRLAHLGLGGIPGPRDHAAVDAALRLTDCGAWQHRRLPALSGGERQRVLLARALATEAPWLLLDEPTTHLDPPHQLALVRLLRDLSRAQAVPLAPPAAEQDAGSPRSVVTVLHDLPLALQADRVVVLDAGRIAAHGLSTDPEVHRALESVFQGAVRLRVTEGEPRVELALDARRSA